MPIICLPFKTERHESNKRYMNKVLNILTYGAFMFSNKSRFFVDWLYIDNTN